MYAKRTSAGQAVPGLSGLRVFYVGSSGRSGNGLDKRRAIESLGVEVPSFDTLPYQQRGGFPLRSVAHRANLGPPVRALNRDILERARELSDVSVVWVDKGQWLWPETLRELRSRWHARLVHYSNDSMLWVNRSRHFRTCIPLYDILFTTKRWEVEGHRRLGARRIQQVFDSVDEDRFRPVQATTEQQERFGSEVSFIGRTERHYARSLENIARSGVDLRIWGPGWPAHARWHRWARSAVRGAGVWFDEYPVALSCARIGLGLLSKLFPEDHTTRSLEIPACGTFLLAERTPAHQELYEEGREAEFFEGTEEMLDKIRYYLAHPDQRSRIALAGRERYLRSDHGRQSRYRRMLELALAAGGEDTRVPSAT